MSILQELKMVRLGKKYEKISMDYFSMKTMKSCFCAQDYYYRFYEIITFARSGNYSTNLLW